MGLNPFYRSVSLLGTFLAMLGAAYGYPVYSLDPPQAPPLQKLSECSSLCVCACNEGGECACPTYIDGILVQRGKSQDPPQAPPCWESTDLQGEDGQKEDPYAVAYRPRRSGGGYEPSQAPGVWTETIPTQPIPVQVPVPIQQTYPPAPVYYQPQYQPTYQPQYMTLPSRMSYGRGGYSFSSSGGSCSSGG